MRVRIITRRCSSRKPMEADPDTLLYMLPTLLLILGNILPFCTFCTYCPQSHIPPSHLYPPSPNTPYILFFCPPLLTLAPYPISPPTCPPPPPTFTPPSPVPPSYILSLSLPLFTRSQTPPPYILPPPPPPAATTDRLHPLKRAAQSCSE